MTAPAGAAAAAAAAPASAFAALGDPTRLGIVGRLGACGPLSTIRLAAATPLSRQAVAKHLNALAAAGLVHGRRRGRDLIWEIRSDRLEEAKRHLAEISAQWDEALARLRDLVEESPD